MGQQVARMIFHRDFNARRERVLAAGLKHLDAIGDACPDAALGFAVLPRPQDHAQDRRAQRLRRFQPQPQMLFRRPAVVAKPFRGRADAPRAQQQLHLFRGRMRLHLGERPRVE